MYLAHKHLLACAALPHGHPAKLLGRREADLHHILAKSVLQHPTVCLTGRVVVRLSLPRCYSNVKACKNFQKFWASQRDFDKGT